MRYHTDFVIVCHTAWTLVGVPQNLGAGTGACLTSNKHAPPHMGYNTEFDRCSSEIRMPPFKVAEGHRN